MQLTLNRNFSMLRRSKYVYILPTLLASPYSTGFDWKKVFAKSEGDNKIADDKERVFSPSRFKSDFLERIQSQSLDDYTKRALKGISDAVTKNKDGRTIEKPKTTQAVDLTITEEGKGIYDKVPEVFAAFQMSLGDNKLRASISKIFEKTSSDNGTLALPQKIIKADMYDIIPSSVLDEKTKGYLRELSALGDKLRSQFDKSTMNLQHPFIINLGLLRLYILYQAAQARVAAANASPAPCPISESFLSEAKYFLRFAAEIYDDNPYISSDDVLLDQLGEHAKLSANVKIPRHIVFLDHLTKSVVISIRGTGSVSDVLTDLHLDAKPFIRGRGETPASRSVQGKTDDESEGVAFFKKALEQAASKVQASIERKLAQGGEGALYAHSGMADSAHALLGPVVAAIHDAHSRRGGRYRDYQIVVTGHSLGAGTGCLLAMLVASHTSLPVKTFAFAPPPVLSRDVYPIDYFAAAAAGATKKKPLPTSVSELPSGGNHSNCVIHSFIHHNDVVPRASHFELLNLLSAIGSVDALPWTPTDRSLLLLRGKLTEEEAALMQEYLAKAENYHQENEGVELCVPGHIYWLQPISSSSSSNSGEGSEVDVKIASPAKSVFTSAAKRYRVKQIDDSRKVFNGYLYTGDSMVVDHLVDYYMAAILNIDSSDKTK
jgi:hypothetical protein